MRRRDSSAGPISEPVVDLLLELSWSSGRVSREYTAFIDPPFIVAERERQRVQEALAEAEAADQVAETRAASLPDAPTPQPLPDEPGSESVTVTSPDAAIEEGIQTETVSAPEAVEETVLAPVETIGGTGATMFEAFPESSTGTMSMDETMAVDMGEPAAGKPIGVIRGDTLSKIALANKPAGVTLEQMLVVLFRNNPDAFSANNMNRLRTGKIIRLGDPDEYRNVDQARALQEVRVQFGDFKAYRERVAAAAMQQPTGEQPAQQTAAGTVTPKVEDGAPASMQTPSEVVKLSRGEPAAAGQPGAGQAEVRALEEKLVASEKALQESNDRVARLENIIEDLQKLAEVQSQDMAELQSQAAATAQPAETAQPAATPAPAPPSPPQPTAEVKPAPATPAPETPAATAPDAPAQPDQPAGGEPTTPPAAATGQTTAQAPAQAPAAPTSEPSTAPAPAAQKPVRRAPPPPPPPPPSLIDQVLAPDRSGSCATTVYACGAPGSTVTGRLGRISPARA
jgi:pilus assembly protein FimV